MNAVQFAQEMTQRGCVTDGSNHYCGTYNGYPFTTVYNNGRQGGKTSFMLSLVLGGSVSQGKLFKATRKKLKESVPGTIKIINGDTSANTTATWYMFGAVGAAMAASAQTAISGSVFTAIIKKEENFSAAFEALMSCTVQSAIELGYGVPDTCPVCKSAGCDAYAFYENGYRPVHDGCVREKAVALAAKHDENQRTGSYLLGFVGALIGACIGAIPNILLLVFFDLIAGLACVLIPVCAYWFYKLFRGKRTKAATWFVVLASVLVVPVMDYTIEWFTYSYLRGYPLTPGDYIYAFTTDPTLFFIDWAFMLFFVAIGIAIAWGIIKKDGGTEVAQAAFSVDTLRPMTYNAAGVAVMAPAAPAAQAAPMPAASEAPAPTMQSNAAAQAERDLEA